jgi:hypothetical protein
MISDYAYIYIYLYQRDFIYKIPLIQINNRPQGVQRNVLVFSYIGNILKH